MFIKSLAAKRDEIGNKMVHYHGGVVYIYPLAGLDVEKACKEFKLNAPATIAGMIVEHMNNAQLAPVYRKWLEDSSEIVNFVGRHLLLEVPSPRNRRAFVDSVESTEELVLQTCSLDRLKHKYLGYSVSDEEREFYGWNSSGIGQEVQVNWCPGEATFEKKEVVGRYEKKGGKVSLWEEMSDSRQAMYAQPCVVPNPLSSVAS